MANQILLKQYFTNFNPVNQVLDSFNKFVEVDIPKIIAEIGEVSPTVLPPEIQDFKIKIGKVWVEKPQFVEADGSRKTIFPSEARLRKLTYAAPIYANISVIIDGVQREAFTSQIGKLPIMVRSKYCNLYKLSREQLVKAGEDPDDYGGYFIINGNERVVITAEDLMPNKLFIQKNATGPSQYTARIFSQRGPYNIPHTIEQMKDGIIYLSFTKFKRVPILLFVKALGIVNDKEIMENICSNKEYDDVYLNLYQSIDIKSEDDAFEQLAKKIGLTQPKELKIDKVAEQLDLFLLPHIGTTSKERLAKAYHLCKVIKRFLQVTRDGLPIADKDHYKNKKLKLPGELLADLFRVNMHILINDILSNLQRLVKRKKFQTVKIIIRDKLLTSRLKSAVATGSWVGGRKGISQNIDRTNSFAVLSHLTRVVSQLSSTQENFDAREVHSTHWGRLCPIETPEGTSIGLRKNLAMLCKITIDEIQEDKLKKQLSELGLKLIGTKQGNSSNNLNGNRGTDVFLDEKFIGNVSNAREFVTNVREERRKQKLPDILNISYTQNADIVEMNANCGRARRPLIIVENGKSKLTEEHISMLINNEITWDDLVNMGIIEYLDANEEEDAYIALDEKYLTKEHTHVEINPLTILGVITALVPYANFGQSSRLIRGSKTQKQSLGLYATNYLSRVDTDVSVLQYPQKPIVKTLVHDFINYETHPAGQNIVLAILSSGGYNMQDAIIINKASIERGFARSFYFRQYSIDEITYQGGLSDQICIPDKEVKGYRSEHDYRFLEDDGIVYPEAKIDDESVIIGRTSPPKFLEEMEEFSISATARRESSVTIKKGEKGIIDAVYITENEEGNRLIQLRVRDERIAERGDKFASRYGQKGVIGDIVPFSDMPFSTSGIVPDIIFSPHSIPSRMTVSHLIEILAGKLGALKGEYIDGTTFSAISETELRKMLHEMGFRENGTERLYNGITGEEYTANIYVGDMYYLKLKYMVANKLHARATGRVQLLTRQPLEGRSKGGGLRLGEMEKDCLVAHGSSMLLKERFDSDKIAVPVCKSCGTIAIRDAIKDKLECPRCGENVDIDKVEISYAFKLLLDELSSMLIDIRLKMRSKYHQV